MWISDKAGTKIDLKQARSGGIYFPIGTNVIIISKEESAKFPLYDIEDFDVKNYEDFYKEKI
jgi:hypothetical protein